MILEYHRPNSISAALELLARSQPRTLPLGGGTTLNIPSPKAVAVVDLQNLSLNGLDKKGSTLNIGATCTLEKLQASHDIPAALRQAILSEAGLNIRNQATVAGRLMALDGRSPLAAVMLAMDARLTVLPGEEQVGLGNLYPLREQTLSGRLITQISIPLNLRLSVQSVARTPADHPVLYLAVAQWPSGRTRVVVGGWGKCVHLAMDGPDATGVENAVRNAVWQAEDALASAAYRQQVVVRLADRSMQEIGQDKA